MLHWKHTSYLQKGLSHTLADTACQDSVLITEDEHCIVAALADGLGSLPYSHVAADTATHTVCQLFASLGNHRIQIESAEGKLAFALDIVSRTAAQILQQAEGMGLSPREMDCTLVFAYISKDHNYAITGRLGDSAVCVIGAEDSIAINDSCQSANGTSAILDADAHEHMEIDFWEIDAQGIQGFILTSDGLDNELYRKGSAYVNQAAEDYFNCLVLSPEPKAFLAERVGTLTQPEDSSFDDDISIAILSRAEAPVSFPADPTWLCTCGHRNRLQDTYCCNCDKDFSVLYQNVCFREHGGKAAFFLEINKHPEEERQLIGIDAEEPQVSPLLCEPEDLDLFEMICAPSETLAAPQEDPDPAPIPVPDPVPVPSRQQVSASPPKHTGSTVRRKKAAQHQVPIPSVLDMIWLALCVAVGSVLVRLNLLRNTKKLCRKIELLAEIVRRCSP